MTTRLLRQRRAESAGHLDTSCAITGWIAHIEAQAGQLHVDFAGNEGPPIAARSLVTIDLAAAERAAKERTPIALAFEDGDRARPIILGLIRDQAVVVPGAEPDPDEPSYVRRRSLIFEGEEQVLLRCGEATIELAKDGKIIIHGAHVVSHADGVQRIRGGSIQIN